MIIIAAVILSAAKIASDMITDRVRYGQDMISRCEDYAEWEGPFYWSPEQLRLIGEWEQAQSDVNRACARAENLGAYQQLLASLEGDKEKVRLKSLIENREKELVGARLRKKIMEGTNVHIEILALAGQRQADEEREMLEAIGVGGTRWKT